MSLFPETTGKYEEKDDTGDVPERMPGIDRTKIEQPLRRNTHERIVRVFLFRFDRIRHYSRSLPRPAARPLISRKPIHTLYNKKEDTK